MSTRHLTESMVYALADRVMVAAGVDVWQYGVPRQSTIDALVRRGLLVKSDTTGPAYLVTDLGRTELRAALASKRYAVPLENVVWPLTAPSPVAGDDAGLPGDLLTHRVDEGGVTRCGMSSEGMKTVEGDVTCARCRAGIRDGFGSNAEIARRMEQVNAAREHTHGTTTRGTAGTSRRSAIQVHAPLRPGNGTSRHWSRRLAGKLYAFAAIAMPNGERRYTVKRFDGRPGTEGFDAYWTRLHFITIPPPATLDPVDVSMEQARIVAPTLRAPGKIGAALDSIGRDSFAADVTRSTLRALVAAGLATETADRPRRYYLTDAGRRARDTDAAEVTAAELAKVVRTYGTCQAQARQGTGFGMCGRPLDAHGQCDRAADHIGGDR